MGEKTFGLEKQGGEKFGPERKTKTGKKHVLRMALQGSLGKKEGFVRPKETNKTETFETEKEGPPQLCHGTEKTLEKGSTDEVEQANLVQGGRNKKRTWKVHKRKGKKTPINAIGKRKKKQVVRVEERGHSNVRTTSRKKCRRRTLEWGAMGRKSLL